MFGMGLPEIVIIVLVIVVVFFFGEKKLSGLAKGLGRVTAEFKKGKVEVENEMKKVKDEFKLEPNIKRNQSRKTKKTGEDGSK